MSDLEKYLDQIVAQRLLPFESPPDSSGETTTNLIPAILRRWRVVLLVFFAMCAIGITAIWLLIEPLYNVTGAIRVAPILPNILTGEADKDEISNYQTFANTQAEMMTSSNVIQRVADDLADKNLAFFENQWTSRITKLKQGLNKTKEKPELTSVLKQAVSDGIICVIPPNRTEFIKINMLYKNPEESRQIVNAFIKAYMAVEVSTTSQAQNRQLSVLENELRVLTEKLQGQRETISELEFLRMNNEHGNSNPELQEMARKVAQLEQELILARQILTAQNPTIKQEQESLDALKSNLEVKRHEISSNQVTVQNLEDQLSLIKETYDKVCRRIQELEMERKSSERVSVAYDADIVAIQDKRIKYSVALMFGAMACGMLTAFWKDKADLSLHTPDDVAKHIGIRIIGTTTGIGTVKKALLPKMIAEDYQAIRANLGSLDGEGIPKKLVITSAGMGDGKTTFAINLATSISKSGKKVLLIDGDLRKPDIAHLLNLPSDSKGLQEVLVGKDSGQTVCQIASSGLDVLAADSHNIADAYELLTLPMAAKHISSVSQKYDHIIIDTPPILAFPDALVWAKMADAVILVSFAGQTTAPDLKEAKEKLAQINVKVLGTVLSNVRAGYGYYRYGYNYSTQDVRQKTSRNSATKNRLLLPLHKDDNDTKGSDAKTS
jgi:capsular exopolysaccharide synthesis family protein